MRSAVRGTRPRLRALSTSASNRASCRPSARRVMVAGGSSAGVESSAATCPSAQLRRRNCRAQLQLARLRGATPPPPPPRRVHLTLELAPPGHLRLRDPRRLRGLAGHAGHLLGLGPAELAGGDGFTQLGQPVEVVGQALELPVAVAAEAQFVDGIQFQRRVAQQAEEFAALDLGEPEDGTFAGAVAGGQGLAQGGVDGGGGLVGV
jgi:hypothetical protein